MQATLNVRMDSIAKNRGDEVLRDNGISTSEAVRLLWEYLGETKEIPDFMKKRTSNEREKSRKLKVAKGLCGIAEGKYSHLTDEELHEIYMSQYE